jgi:hypothetical protein
LRGKGRLTTNRYVNDWMLALCLGLVILPASEMFTLFAILKFENFEIAGKLWMGFYSTLFSAPWYVLVFKLIYLVIVFPLIVNLILPRVVPPKKVNPDQKSHNYCI